MRNLECWAEVGAVPATRACLSNPKVRIQTIPEEYEEYLRKAEESIIDLDVVVEYSNNASLLTDLRKLEKDNHSTINELEKKD